MSSMLSAQRAPRRAHHQGRPSRENTFCSEKPMEVSIVKMPADDCRLQSRRTACWPSATAAASNPTTSSAFGWPAKRFSATSKSFKPDSASAWATQPMAAQARLGWRRRAHGRRHLRPPSRPLHQRRRANPGLRHRNQDYPVKFAEVDETIAWQLKFPSGIIANCNTTYNAEGYIITPPSPTAAGLASTPPTTTDSTRACAATNKRSSSPP